MAPGAEFRTSHSPAQLPAPSSPSISSLFYLCPVSTPHIRMKTWGFTLTPCSKNSAARLHQEDYHLQRPQTAYESADVLTQGKGAARNSPSLLPPRGRKAVGDGPALDLLQVSTGKKSPKCANQGVGAGIQGCRWDLPAFIGRAALRAGSSVSLDCCFPLLLARALQGDCTREKRAEKGQRKAANRRSSTSAPRGTRLSPRRGCHPRDAGPGGVAPGPVPSAHEASL